MAMLPGRRKSDNICRTYSRRRSLVKCDKCRHTARNHFNLRRHLAKYHSLNIAQKCKFRKHSHFSRHWKIRKLEKREFGVSRRVVRPPKSETEAFKVGKLVVLRDNNLEKPKTKTTSVAVRNELKTTGILECTDKVTSTISRTGRVSRKTPKAAELTVKSPARKLRSSRRSSQCSDPQARAKRTKPKTISLKSRRGPKKKKKKREKRCLIPLPCHLCDYVGRDSYNLRRHMQSKHEPKPPKVPKIYQCDECEYKNRHRFLVKRHSATHSREGSRREGKFSGFACDKCDYVSASACNLKRHQVCRHENPKEAKLQCSLCDHREPDRPALFCHFREAHGVIIETEKLEFDDFQSFMNFKMDTEKATFARFVRQQTRMGQKKHVIFKCHRDGMFKSKSRGERKRALKTTGSNKINSACPASMKMTIDPSGRVSVVFTKTHVGHSNEVCRLTLTKEEKILIAEMLESKRTFQDILCEIRNGMESERLERIHLLSRKDLQNIERWYKTREAEAPRISIDIDIENWVTNISQETSVVRLYKKPATILPKPFKCLEYDDFILVLANELQLVMLRQFGNMCICIDSAYENSQIKLTTLMILDDSRQSFPCAFMLSSKIDKIIMKVFLEVVKKESGCPMTPSILISDIPDYRRTEWSAVMDLPASTEVLYSPWSVEDDLKRNLLKIKNETERQEAFKVVSCLTHEKNPSEIPHLLEKTLKQLDENPSTELFGKYFKSKFADTVRKWATGLRNCFHADSSDSLERMHDILKFVYSEGMKNRKLEDCICVLMTCGRDQLQDRIVLDEGVFPETLETTVDSSRELVNSIAKRHEDAVNMKSQPADSGVFEIMENSLRCRCGLRCFECGICIHSYRCTCSDSVLGWTVCRHIHFCVISNPVEQEGTVPLVASHPFDPAEEKRKLLLEFENMCDDIAADEDSIDEGTVVVVPVLEELPQEDNQLEQDVKHFEQEHPVKLQQSLSPPKQQPSSPHPPQELEDVKNKLQWRFQSICQLMSSGGDVTLVEQALASIENAIIASRQNSIQQ